MSECGDPGCWCCGDPHVCEPPRYPDDINETWKCPECGVDYIAFPASDEPEVARLPGIDPDRLGWMSRPPART